MKPTLKPGDTHDFAFVVPPTKTVPAIMPESDIFTGMPEVLATGFMVAIMEWACAEAIRPHLEEGEGSLGTLVDVTHVSPTLPGMTVRVAVTVESVEGSRMMFRVVARDDCDVIGEGRHGRAAVRWDRFGQKLEEKRAKWRQE